MTSLPIRLRLTLTFMAMMLVVLAGTGSFVYLRLRSELDRALRDGLHSRAAAVAAIAAQEDSGLPNLQSRTAVALGGARSFTELVDPSGVVLASSVPSGSAPTLTRGQASQAIRRTLIIDRAFPGTGESFRLFARPGTARRHAVAIIAGISLAERDGTLRRLLLVLAIAEGAALAVAAIAAYAIVSASLRPVDRMRRRAVLITAANTGERLPVPRARDEMAHLAESLNAMLDRLQHALTHERKFVADASHELRTPLGLVKSELELALYEDSSYEDLRAALLSALKENDHAVALADDLLVLARLDHDQLPLRQEQIIVSDLFAELQARFQTRATQSGRIIAVEKDGAHSLFADPQRVTQALSNLIENALHHGAGDVCLLADQTDGITRLHVRDHGSGFPDPFLAHAFDRFAQADPARGSAHSGLGLALVHAIATALGGSAHAANAVSGGAHVWLELPTRAQRNEPEGNLARKEGEADSTLEVTAFAPHRGVSKEPPTTLWGASSYLCRRARASRVYCSQRLPRRR